MFKVTMSPFPTFHLTGFHVQIILKRISNMNNLVPAENRDVTNPACAVQFERLYVW